MKKVLSLLAAAAFYCSFAAIPLLAGETIVYTGDTSILQTVDGKINSLAPSGSSSGKSNSLSGNNITINASLYLGGPSAGNVYGAINLNDTTPISSNTITVTSGSISDIYGGYSKVTAGNAVASGNTVTFSGGTVSSIYGGYSKTNAGDSIASGNTITFNGGTVSQRIYGGYAWSASADNTARASNNTINITSGTLANIYGGYVAGYATGLCYVKEATNNTINISGSSRVGLAAIYGGYNEGGGSDVDVFTGNTLNIYSRDILGISSSLQNFEYINFFVDGYIGLQELVVDDVNTIKLNTNGNNCSIGSITNLNSNDRKGGIEKIGDGTLTLSSNNTYTGSTTISSGTLVVQGNLGDSFTKNYAGAIINNAALVFDQYDNQTLSGSISGSGTLTKGGDWYVTTKSTLTLSGNNTYTGNTTVNVGTLEVTGTLGNGNYAGAIINDAALVFNQSANQILSGSISGSGSLTKKGSGTLTLSGNNTYTGNMTIDAGTLEVTGSLGFIFYNGAITNNGKLVFNNQTTDQILWGNISGSGSLIKEGSWTLVLSEANTYTGWTEVRGGCLTINLSGTISDKLALYDGTEFNTNGANVNLNRLDVRGNAAYIGNLTMNNKTLNFYLPETMTADETMLIVTNTANITNSKIGVTINGDTTPLKIGDRVTLIETINGLTANGINTRAFGVDGVAKILNFNLFTDANNLYARVAGIAFNPQTKILSEGAAAGAIIALTGTDNISGNMLNDVTDDKIGAFGGVFGGSSKYDTGSSVEMNAFGLIAGIAKGFGSFDAGIFAEYVSGSFDTKYDKLKGNGNASAIGLGIIVKAYVNHNLYTEGLIRAGQVSNDYKTEVSGFNADFDYNAMYFGFSLGGGNIFEVSEKIDIDVFGKYTLTNVSGSDATLSTGEKYEFDAALSNRIKAGAKGEYKINDMFKPYLQIAYDYELSGDINAKINNDKVEAPTLNGGTFNAGIGTSAKIAENFSLDLGVNIYSGAKEGVTGSLQGKYSF